MVWRSAYGHSSRVFDVAFSPDGASIVSASEDTTARVWRCADGTQAALLSGHTAEVLRASWRSDGAVIATGSADRSAKLWRLTGEYAAECAATLAEHPEELYCCDWLQRGAQSQQHDKLVTASGSVVALWDVGGAAPRRISELKLASEDVFDGIPDMWRETSLFGCAQHPSRPLAACACSDGVVHIVGLGDGAVSAVQSINVAADMRRAVMCRGAAWRRDGSQLAVATSDGALVAYDSATWRPRSRIGVPGGVLAPLWSPTMTSQLLFASEDTVQRVDTDADTTGVLFSRYSGRKLLCLAISACGTRCAASGEAADVSRGNTRSLPGERAVAGHADGAAGRAREPGARDEGQGLADHMAAGLTIAPARRRQRGGAGADGASERAPIELWSAADFRDHDEAYAELEGGGG